MSETKPTSDPKPKTDEAAPTDEQIAGTVGAHVALPPDSKAAQGARGVFPTLQENIDHRDAGLVEMGLDPADPSGSGRDPEPKPVEPAPVPATAAAHAGPPTPRPSGSKEA